MQVVIGDVNDIFTIVDGHDNILRLCKITAS